MKRPNEGKDAKEDNDEEMDGGEEALDAIEKRLQVKIKQAVGKQVGRLIDVAERVEDPTDALVLLNQGSDVVHTLKMQQMTKIDHRIPQPSRLETEGVVGITLPEGDLTPAAFSNMDTADLYQALLNMRQQAVGKWANLTKPSLLPDNAAAKTAFGDILDVIEQVGLVHYEIVRAGLYLHILLSQQYAKFDALPFLTGKGHVEQILLRYNAHNPHLCIGIEEEELNGAQTILAVVNRVSSYLMSAEFYTYREKKTSVAGGNGKSIQGRSTGGGPVFSARVNLVREMPNQLKPEKDVLEARGDKGGKKVLQTSATIVPVVPLAIDLGEDRDPKTVLNEISRGIQGLVEKGMDLIYQLKKIARPVNFNIYTLQFGEATPLQDNRTMMQKMRKVIYQHVMKDLKLSASLSPMLFLRHKFLTQAFAGRYGAGPAVDAVSLDPGEEREITHETTVTTKRMTEESDSIFDAKTTAVKDSLERSRQDQLQKTNTDTTQVDSYFDTSRQTDTAMGVKASVKYKSPLGALNLGVDADWSRKVSEGVAAGSSQSSNSCRETSVNNTEGMIQNHTEEVSANRERTQTKTTRQEEELSQKDKEVRKTRNPNRSSPMTLLFCKLIQHYNNVMGTPGFVVAFGNGAIIVEETVSEVQTAILDRFVKKDALETRKRVLDLIRDSAKVIDYKGRCIDLLAEEGGVMRLRNEYYFDLLAQQKHELEAEDLALLPYKKNLKGVVLSTSEFSLPQCGLLRQGVVGDPVLDDTEQQFVALELEKFGIQNGQAKQQLENQKAFCEYFKSLKEPGDKTKAGFLLMQPPADILQKGSLSLVAGPDKSDPTGLSELQKYLRSLKMDV